MALSLRGKIVFSLILGSVLFFFWTLGTILSPFILGSAMAYGYRPLHRFFRKKSMSVTLSAFLLALTTYGIFTYVVLKIIPIVGTWSSLLSSHFTLYREAFWTFFAPLMVDFFKDAGPAIQEGMDVLLRQSMQWLGSLMMVLLHNSWALGQIFLTLALSPVIAFYLLKDGGRIRQQFYALVPIPYRGVTALCMRDMDRALRQYFSGQVRVCFLLAGYYALFLEGFLHVPGAIKLAVLSGFLVFIPYVGFFMSLFSACMVGVIESGQWPYVGSIALVYLGGNILESLVLTPYLVGSRTGLHPLWVLLAVLIGGGIKGIIGIILALPVATMGGACWRLFRKWYGHSTLHQKENFKKKNPL